MLYSSLAGDYADYYDWLMDIVGGVDWWGDYEKTMVRVFDRKYYWTNAIDGNMVAHVENLRAQAMRERASPFQIPIGEPSVLEVLVYLSIEIDRLVMADGDSQNGERVPEFFETMAQKLGFDCSEAEIDHALDEFLSGERTLGAGKYLWNQAQMLFLKQFEVESG